MTAETLKSSAAPQLQEPNRGRERAMISTVGSIARSAQMLNLTVALSALLLLAGMSWSAVAQVSSDSPSRGEERRISAEKARIDGDAARCRAEVTTVAQAGITDADQCGACPLAKRQQNIAEL